MAKRNTRNVDRSRPATGPTALSAALAIAAAAVIAAPARAGTTGSLETVSISGSTALKNWLVSKTTTFTDVQPGSTLTVNGVTYPPNTSYWQQNGGSLQAYQLAPSSYNGGQSTFIDGSGTGLNSTTTAAITPAYRFEYHESGSVEGILEMANDQIAPVTYVTQNVNRNPNGGNAVWVNYNQIGGVPATGYTPFVNGGVTANGYTLGNFYNGPSQAFTYGSASNPTAVFNLSGGNVNGGQNAVQAAVSDVVPIQAFASNNTSGGTASPWAATPGTAGYGQGNTLLTPATIGVAGSRQVFQSTASLNMSAGAINPRTGRAFGTGAWNSAGLGNLNSQTVAVTASVFVANPGTGLTQVDRTDTQFLETTGRLANGASFNMTTRDVNSGTRNVTALETGIDPTYASGVNDNGNGNAADGGTAQITIGANLRFSNKTAGGAQLRPTVQASRMAVGTLSINDASGNTTNAVANPLRVLKYSDSTNGSAPYVLANYGTISTGQYTIFQNEQFVTVKAPDASYSPGSTGASDIQGDDSTGDVKALLNNTLTSVNGYYSGSSPASPADGLLSQGYILPQLMQVQKAQNGLNVAGTASAIVSNASYNASLASGTAFNGLVSKLNSGDPTTVMAGSNSFYGGSTNAAGGVLPANATGGVGFVDQIPITSSNAGAGGNYLVGNFNQNGVRDYDAVVVQALTAVTALEASGAGNSAFSGMSNATVVNTGITALQNMPNSAGGTGSTKGDLITMGDYNGDGVFNGRDLYDLAVGASLATSGSGPTENTSSGAATFTTGRINATAATFSTAIASSVLYKNTALDYLQANATSQEKVDATAVLEGGTVPSGATALGTDTESGLTQYTFDPTGVNAFNKSDVNSDGVVDMNDAVLVDKYAGYSYSNLGNNLTATEQAPVTGAVQLANLVLVSQVDGSSAIGSADLAVMNAALTGVGNTNWYGYNLQKTGTGTITMARTGGTVIVYAGASFEVSGGAVQVGPAQDAFSDNTSGTTTSGNHVALTLDNGGKLQFTGGGGTSTVAGLSINTSSGSQLDVGKNFLNVQYAAAASPLAAIAAEVMSGYANNANNGPGIITSSADANHTVGYVDTGSAVKVQYALNGDTDLSGKVNITDFTTLKQNFGKTSGALWSQGDSNHDGKVNITDFTLLKANFGQTLTTSVVAQPSVATLAATAAAPTVTLVVNTTTGDGQLVLSNAKLGGYEIDSASGELTPSGWKTLSSQGYTQFSTLLSTSDGLSEDALSGSLSYNGTIDIGNIFNALTTAASRDLDFTYEDDSNPAALTDIDVPVDYVSATPEPTSLLLVGAGATPLLGRRRRATRRPA